MLALTRRVNEEIVIGDPSNPMGVIRVVSVHGDKVRLSFDFPRDVKINRRELAELKKKMSSENIEFVENESKPQSQSQPQSQQKPQQPPVRDVPSHKKNGSD